MRARPGVAALAGVAFFCACFQAQAIVDANSKSNTNAPTDGAPWANVGGVNGAGGIYLAAGWGLTAAHVGPGNMNLGGMTLPYDGTYYRLTNSDGTFTDMVLFHLSKVAPVPSLPLATTAPAVSSAVDFVGFGHIAATGPTTLGSYTGFTWTPPTYKAWGNNRVTGNNFVYNAGLGNVTLFYTDFDATGQTSDECQATDADSGGGVFLKSGSTWQLAGMTDLVGTLQNQPASTSVYGHSTYAAQISTYRSQIIALLGSIPPVLSASRSGGAVNVCWPDPGIPYTLQSTLKLAPALWSTVSQPQAATNGLICVSIPTTNNTTFFRLLR